jgi:hypothetical protein
MPGLALHTVVDGDIVTDADGKSFIVREITRNSAGQISRIAGAPLAELAEIDLSSRSAAKARATPSRIASARRPDDCRRTAGAGRL